MKYKKLVLFLLTAITASAQKHTEEFVSSILGETRLITVVTPPYYKDDSDKNYPLLLLLDGDYLVDPFSGNFSYTSYFSELPDVIIVGINQNRNKERVADTECNKETGFPDNKGAEFFEFIGAELLPFLEAKYNVAPFRIVAGHNITAGFINAFLFKEKPLFDAYISLSPVLPKGMETMIPERLAGMKKPIYYYMADADGDSDALQKKIKVLDQGLSAIKNPALKYHFDAFTNTTHYALATQAIPAAIYHIFSSHQPISLVEYQSKIVSLPSGYVTYLENKYTIMEKELGYKTQIRLNDFKAIETAIIENAAFSELKDLAQLARENYPKTIFSEYYTALFYEKTGNTERAIKTYLNSYPLKETGGYTKDFVMDRAESLKRN